MSIFAKAKTVVAKPTGKAKSDKQEIAMAGIANLAKIKALMVSLEAASKTMEAEIKENGFGQFLAMETNVRPESFKGLDGVGSASVEMRKRSTLSALNEDEQKVLADLGLTTFKNVKTVEMYGINPAYALDDELMGKVSKALEKIVPDDFIVLQAEVATQVVNDELLEAAFRLPHGSDERKTALSLCTTMALKPRLSADYDMSKLSADVDAILNPKDESEKVEKLEAEGAKLVAAAEPVAKVRKPRAAKVVAA